MKPTTSYDEFIPQWHNKIFRIMRSRGIRPDDLEDCFQTILAKMVECDGLNRYNPLISHFSTYVYAVVLSETQNYYTRQARHESRYSNFTSLSKESHSETAKSPGDPLSQAMTFEDYYEADSPDATDLVLSSEFFEQIEEIRYGLSAIPVRSFAEVETQDGIERRPRSHLMVFEMILQGFNQKEIAEYLVYSVNSVNLLIHQIREMPEAKRLLRIWKGQ